MNDSIEVNPKSNGGETLLITTNFIDDGDPEPIIIQEISLMSYGNSANFQLGGNTVLTSDFLRKLANELDVAPLYVQVERLTARHPDAPKKELMSRILSQISGIRRLKYADYVIDNSGTVEETLRQADVVLQEIKEQWQ